ncbi:MAG TPA: 30S ribosomal protein S3 [Verrucomicrobiales bacterium]|nr:30S ribosomal protein S3 [Verrucomicrobiae bacterium]MCP5554137.1 30S ribosomal protein S3 [Akkermansiaceae bacterium]HRX56608.1 30S ribosomal protein S3 [Verrucomicrobiales bacterium]
MGQKVNPIGFRLAVNKDWRSKWFAPESQYAGFLHDDIRVRNFLKKKLQQAAISKIVIERAWNSVRVTLHTSRPGLVIGRKGSEIEKMTAEISGMCSGAQVKIDIYEIKQPELDAQLVAETVATQLERRIAFRRAMKRVLQTAMDFGADGIRIRCAGRLQGSDIARAEWYREGKVPLQSLRAPIEYGFAEAQTVWGTIGVKCWINRREDAQPTARAGRDRRDRGDRGDRRRDNNGPGHSAAPAPGGASH